jgi:adenylate cyclase
LTSGWLLQRLKAHGVAGAGLLLALLVWLVLHLGLSGALTQLEERAGDLAWRLGAEKKDEQRLILVDIDERSQREVGPWPWPRATQARLMDQIAAAGASQQIFDVRFADPQPDDAALIRAVDQHRPVLAQIFALEQGSQALDGQLAGALDWAACPYPFGESVGYLGSFAALVAPAPGRAPVTVGHITPRVAPDGFVRQQPAVICNQGKSYPALGLAAVMRGAGEHSIALERGAGWLDAPWRLTAPNLAPGYVPLDSRGDIRVSWLLDPDSFISVSASDVLAGKLPPGLLSKAWVLVGSSAFGLNDSIATPFHGVASGLQVHAQLITALLDGRTPYTPVGAPAIQLLLVLAGASALVLLVRPRPAGKPRFPVYLLPMAATGYGLLLWLGHALLLVRGAVWIGWLEPTLFLLAAGSAMGALAHAKSRWDRDRLYTHLSSYLPAPVAAALALQPPSSAIKAHTKQVSVMFADIRNFSAYCEARPPEEAAAVLHAFFSTASTVVQAQGGVIEAFQGDAIIAVWNGDPVPDVPGETINYSQRALQAAINLQAAMDGVLPDPAPAGLEPLSLGIGVETGPAMTGSFGLASRRAHMVMGRTVTIASRLVDMTAELAHPILVGEGLAAQVGGAGLESMGTFLLDGMRVPHHIYAYPLVSAPRIY